MGYLRRFALNRMSLKHISEFGDKKFIFILLQNILIGTLIAFPLVVQVYKSDETKLYKAAFPNLASDQSWIKEITNLEIADGKLTSPQTNKREVIKGNEYLVIDPSGSYKKQGNNRSYIIFTDKVLNIQAYGIQLWIPYATSSLKNFSSSEIKDGSDLLYEISVASKPHLLIPAMQFMYPLSILLNFIFIAIISLFALPMNYRAKNKVSYKKVFTMLSYAATIPAIAAFVLGSITSAAFVYTIYNFGLIFIGYVLFRRYIR